MRRLIHGGVEGAAIDLSTNLNPLGPPPELEEALMRCLREGVHRRYPDPGMEGLKEAIKSFYRLSDWVIPVAGAAEGLMLLLTALRPARVITLSPTFGEHEVERACSVLGCSVRHVIMEEGGEVFRPDVRALAESLGPGDLGLLSSPNNPTGAYVRYEDVVDAAEALPEGAAIVLDTAYSELGPGFPVAVDVPPSLIILHSLTKSLAVPGLRAGFIHTTSEAVAEAVESLRQPWNIPSLTYCAFSEALSSGWLRDYLRASASYVSWGRDVMVSRLRRAGYKVFRSSANFILLKHPWITARELFLRALRAGIGVRPAHTFAGLGEHYTRVAVGLPWEIEAVVRFLESEAPY